ncbi:MAG: hypothetical protein SVZ03_13820 [Spirochaetota bacterium]|nr:hypothetical protein [Spirochaetota bacterium]
MKRLLIIGISLLAVLSLSSCSKNPSDTLGDVQNLYKVDKHEEVKDYYTEGSIKAMEELKKLVPDSQKGGVEIDKKFVSGAIWEVIEEKIDGDMAEIKIKYTDHPEENMKGLEITYNMKKENGRWKIDMEKELNESIKMIKGMNEKMNFFKQ